MAATPPSIATSPPPLPLTERIRTVVVDDHDDIGRLVAHRIADVIRARAGAGGHAVLGLATGSTPIGVYRELIRLHREEGLSFGDVVTFNLDEYYPMDPGSIHAYHRFMWENLFSQPNWLGQIVGTPYAASEPIHSFTISGSATRRPNDVTSFATAGARAQVTEDEPLEDQAEQRRDDHHRDDERRDVGPVVVRPAARSTPRPTRTPARRTPG